MPVKAMIDNGAAMCCVHPRFVERLDKNNYSYREVKETFSAANGSLIVPTCKILTRVVLGTRAVDFGFYVVDGLPADVILGANLLKALALSICYNDNQLRFHDGYSLPLCFDDTPDKGIAIVAKDIILPRFFAVKVPLQKIGNGTGDCIFEPDISSFGNVIAVRSVVSKTEGYTMLLNISRRPTRLHKGQIIGHISYEKAMEDIPTEKSVNAVSESKPLSAAEIEEIMSQVKINPKLPAEQQLKLKTLIRKYIQVFRKNFDNATVANVVEHSINTTATDPISQKPYRASAKEQKIIQEEVAKMLKMGVIRSSKSPWSSPVVLVTKKDGSIRFCVDYRKLNTVTINDAYPIPNIEDNLNLLRGKKFYSSMDAINGFFQIPMKKSDIDKTAFVTADGLYEFLVMPFGIKTNSSCFQRMMDHVLQGIRYDFVLAYIDDILCYSDDFNQHLKHLEVLFERLATSNVKLKVSKCVFGVSEVLYLGYKVSSSGISPDDSKIKAVLDFKVPTNVTELRSFLGLCNYYRKFVRNYSHIAKPLHDLTGIRVEWNWGPTQISAFETLKKLLVSAPILRLPDFNRPFILQTDASLRQVGAVLSQNFDDGEHPILYLSRRLTKSECNYSTGDREFLAMYWSIRTLRNYLFGQEFQVVTDHKPLIYWANYRDMDGRIARWALKLQPYTFSVAYRPGLSHGNADALSRAVAEKKSRNRSLMFLGVINDSRNVIPRKLNEIGKLMAISVGSQMRREQELDPSLKPFFQMAINGHQKYYFDENQVLRRRVFSRVIKDEAGNRQLLRTQLVLPQIYYQEAMVICHDNIMTGGHLGEDKTYAKLVDRFWFPTMKDYSDGWVKTCFTCMKRKPNHISPRGPLLSIPAFAPFETIGMDIVGPIQTSKHSNRYILVITDKFSKWCEAFPLHEYNGAMIAQIIVNHIICRFGCPKNILSDRGSYFIGKIMAKVLELLKIKQILTTPYHPRTNGMTERTNKTIVDMIALAVQSHRDDWDETLPFLTFCYNNSIHKSTGKTPFEIIYGHRAQFPIDNILHPNPTTMAADADYIKSLQSKLKKTHDIVRFALERAQGRQAADFAKRYPKRRQDFKIGDLVMLFREQPDSKFEHRWYGPYAVITKQGPAIYKVQNLETPDDIRVVNDETMKPYISRDGFLRMHGGDPDESGRADSLGSHGVDSPFHEGRREWKDASTFTTLELAKEGRLVGTTFDQVDNLSADHVGKFVLRRKGSEPTSHMIEGVIDLDHAAEKGDVSMDGSSVGASVSPPDRTISFDLEGGVSKNEVSIERRHEDEFSMEREDNLKRIRDLKEKGNGMENESLMDKSGLIFYKTDDDFVDDKTDGFLIDDTTDNGRSIRDETQVVKDSKLEIPSANVDDFIEGNFDDHYVQSLVLDDDVYTPTESNKRHQAKRTAEERKMAFASEREKEIMKWQHLFVPNVKIDWIAEKILESRMTGTRNRGVREVYVKFKDQPKPIWIPEPQLMKHEGYSEVMWNYRNLPNVTMRDVKNYEKKQRKDDDGTKNKSLNYLGKCVKGEAMWYPYH
jgi:hypothetical protein